MRLYLRGLVVVLAVGSPSGGARAQGVGEAVSLGRADAEGAAVAAPPRRLGLFIGIDEFDHSLFHPLKYPRADAEALAAAFRSEGLVDPEDVVVLDGRQAPVTKQRVLAALDALGRRNTRRDDLVFVGISTHGTLGRGDDGVVDQVLVTQDTRPLDEVHASGIPVGELIRRVASFRSQRRVTLIAACNAGLGMSDSLRREWERTKAADAPAVVRASEATVTLFAAGPRQVAIEDAALGHDVYVHYFLRALEEGDLNQDGAVTVTEAHWAAAAKTFEHTGGNQLPQIRIDATGVDPIYLRHTPTADGMPVVWSYEPEEAWLTLLVDGQPKGHFPGPIAVPPGVRRLGLASRPGAPAFASVTASVVAGERLPLAALFAPKWALGVRVGALRPLGARGQNLGRTTPGISLALRRQDPSWGGWGWTLTGALEDSDQVAPEGGAFHRRSAAVTVGGERRLGGMGPLEAFAGAGLGVFGLDREFQRDPP